MEFPVLFLGALPEATPALYSLMNYADIKGGTWYPQGGMYAVVQGMYKLAKELGVSFRFNEEVKQIVVEKGIAQKVITDKQTLYGRGGDQRRRLSFYRNKTPAIPIPELFSRLLAKKSYGSVVPDVLCRAK